jgi:hypothetical protein
MESGRSGGRSSDNPGAHGLPIRTGRAGIRQQESTCGTGARAIRPTVPGGAIGSGAPGGWGWGPGLGAGGSVPGVGCRGVGAGGGAPGVAGTPQSRIVAALPGGVRNQGCPGAPDPEHICRNESSVESEGGPVGPLRTHGDRCAPPAPRTARPATANGWRGWRGRCTRLQTAGVSQRPPLPTRIQHATADRCLRRPRCRSCRRPPHRGSWRRPPHRGPWRRSPPLPHPPGCLWRGGAARSRWLRRGDRRGGASSAPAGG